VRDEIDPSSPPKSSIRAGSPVSSTAAHTLGPSSGQRVPARKPSSFTHASTDTERSDSKRPSHPPWTPSTRTTSSTTALNSSSGGATAATSEAIRRTAVCSSASRRSCSAYVASGSVIGIGGPAGSYRRAPEARGV
jgi:hypothetical protein